MFSIFSEIRADPDLHGKIDQNGGGGQCSNLVLKLNVHVQYNMLKIIWPAPIT